MLVLALASPALSPLQVQAASDPAATAFAPVPNGKGYAVVIGGALKADNEEVWSRMIELSGGKGSRWLVFATASENPDETARRIGKLLDSHGASSESLPIAPAFKWIDIDRAVHDPALLDVVRSAKGIFFSGGAQERIVDTFAPRGQATPMLNAIWEVYQRGGVVAGTSAGAAVMSRVMFRDALSVINVMKGELRDGKEVDQGLGFVGPKLFVDQHFLKRGRFGRMIPLMLAKGYQLGLGVDENSAAVVHGDQIEVIGGKGALLVDLSQAKTNAALGAFNVTGVRLTLLDRGDRYDLAARKLTPSERKLRGERLDPFAQDYKPEFLNDPYYLDMLDDSTIANAMSFLIDSVQKEVRGLTYDAKAPASHPLADLGFSFRLYKGPGSIGWYADELGSDEYTIADLYLDIAPVRMARPVFTPWTTH